MILRGHIIPYWTAKEIHDLEFTTHANPRSGFDSVDEEDWQRYKLITVDIFRGLPACLNRDKLHQEFNWCHNLSYAVSRMTPGSILPWHRDRYEKYRSFNKLTPSESVIRCIVFLESRKKGHFIDIQGQEIFDWRAGDWVCWHDDSPHMACNLGHENRYTLQITGQRRDL